MNRLQWGNNISNGTRDHSISVPICADKEIIISPILCIAGSSLAQMYGMPDAM